MDEEEVEKEHVFKESANAGDDLLEPLESIDDFKFDDDNEDDSFDKDH